jgi:hypothetical protein
MRSDLSKPNLQIILRYLLCLMSIVNKHLNLSDNIISDIVKPNTV